jgi:DNA-binding beta-propeller fold protein YncE
MRRIPAILVVLAAISLVPATASPQLASDTKLLLLGNSGGANATSRLYTIDARTGRGMQPRETGSMYLMGIAFDAQGRLWGVTTFASTPPNSLVRVDPDSGALTNVGPTGFNQLIEGDLAFHPSTGVLYAIQDTGPHYRGLFTLNLDTGAATHVGDIGPGEVSDLSAMTFDIAGELYVIDTERELVLRVDENTAQILSQTPLSSPLGDTAGLAYHPLEERYYIADGNVNGTNSLYTIELASGQLTLIGATEVPDGLAGLAFRPR